MDDRAARAETRTWGGAEPGVLVVGGAAQRIAAGARDAGLAPEYARDAADAIRRLRDAPSLATILVDAIYATGLLASLGDRGGAIRTIVVVGEDEVDLAFDALDAGASELVPAGVEGKELAAALFPEPRPGSTFERNLNAPRLAELSVEVARIAKMLDGLANSDAPLATVEPVEAAPAADAARVRSIIRARRARGQYFAPELFADPAWDILLDLMAARIEAKPVSVSSLCIAAAVPATTALRWIKSMTDEGLLERKPDPVDGRRVFIDLSDAAADSMSGYLANAARSGVAA